MVNASIDASPTTLAAEVVTAAQRLDARAINDVFTHAHAVLGLDAAIDDVVLPALREIGDRWQRGHLDISHEHLCTVATQAWLSEVHQSFPPPTRPSPVILSCGPRDVHTLGLDCMVVLLSRRGWDCRVLGARTPVGSLSLAVRQLDAAAVIVVSHLASARPAAVEAIRSLSTTKVAVFFAGSAFGSRQSRLDLPGTYLGEGMAQAADLVTSRADPRC
jgi:methanogenic corrinoid protein MtbC1